jgi:hypothetical protein
MPPIWSENASISTSDVTLPATPFALVTLAPASTTAIWMSFGPKHLL